MITDILEKTKKLVWPVINSYLTNPVYPKQFRVPAKYQKDLNFYWKTVREYPERQGKYLRPTLLILTCEAMGKGAKKALKTAAAMQLSEDWLLIHDDIEDKSPERRGKPTLHKIFGNEQAINAGDALHIIMWKILSDQALKSINNEFYSFLSRTALGQSTEINWYQSNRFDYTDKDWFFIGNGKTSYYTIAGPMRLGAILGGATNRELDALSEFGVALGRCFQLIDDVLDLTGDFEGLKKQKGNDIFEGKRTLMLGHLLRSASKNDRQRIIRILSKTREGKAQMEVDWIINKMNTYKSIDYARKIAKQYRNQAQEIFDTKLRFLKKEPARSQLKELIDFILERKY